MEFFSKSTNFPFMATRRIWYTLSIAMVLASMFLLFTRGLNLAVDFTGGAVAEASFPAAAPIDRIRDALETAGFKEPLVQNFGSSRDVSVRVAVDETLSVDVVREQLTAALRGVDPAVELKPIEFVGPQVGAELRRSAIQALGITLVLVFIYIVISFHTWRLSVGAILALIHDPILIVGIFALTQTTFDLAVVAALLAIVGYSINDTIIVFDRIRERFEANRRLATPLVLDQSINQTLSRTIMTKFTTLLVVVALFIWGGPVLHGFSLALIIGILVGTYSSIYISSAIALDLGLKAEHVFPAARPKEVDSLP